MKLGSGAAGRIALDEVTIILPTKNEQANIEKFLAAVPDEVTMVVVDASDDRTPERLLELRPQTIVVTAPTNIPVARQLGSDMATTEWLLYTDADVMFAPTYFDLLTTLEVGDDVGGIVGTKTTVAGFSRYHRWFRRGQSTLDAIGIPAATGSNMLVRAEALRAAGGFDPNLTVNEDTELMFRVKRAGYRVPLVSELSVASFDDRRLEMGLARKVGHGAVRNTALYLGLFDRSIRAGDWGYWKSADRPTGIEATRS